jgi:hypothetical protein
VTSSEVNLLRKIKINYDNRKNSDKNRITAAATLTLSFLEEEVLNNKYKLIVLFTHDTHQLPIMRALLGSQEFSKTFNEESRLPFLNSLHINVKDEVLRMFMNDKEFKM